MPCTRQRLRRHGALLLFAITLSALPALAQSCVNYNARVHFMGQVQEEAYDWNYFTDVAVHDEYAYVTCTDAGVAVIDIADRHHPVRVGEWLSPDYAYMTRILWHDGLLLALDGDNGLNLLDVSDPANPTRVGFIAPSEYDFYDMAARGDLLAVTESNVVRFFDIADPAAPLPLGTLTVPYTAYGAAFSEDGDTIYLACYDEGTIIADVSDPSAPTIVGAATIGGTVNDVALAGDYLFCADEGEGLVVFDIGGGAPAHVGTYTVDGQDGNAYGIVIDGDLAYVAANYSGAVIFDIGDPLAVEEKVALPTAMGVFYLAALDGHLYLPVSGYGLYIYDTSNPEFSPAADVISGLTEPTAVAGDAPRVFVGEFGGDIVCVHLETMAVAGRAVMPGRVNALAHRDGYVYGANMTQGLVVVDYRDPADPVQCETQPMASTPEDIEVQGDWLYLLLDDHGLLPFYLGIPDRPEPGAIAGTLLDFDRLTVAGDHAYVVGSDDGWDSAIETFDISDPNHIVSQGWVSCGENPVDLKVDHDRLYYICEDEGLQVFSLDSHGVPTLLSSDQLPGNERNIAIAGGFAYVSNQDSEARPGWVIDVNTGGAPMPIGALGPAFNGREMIVAGDRVWCTDWDRGFVGYPLQCAGYATAVDAPPVATRLDLSAYPNPFNPTTTIAFTLPADARVRLDIVDVTGRLVRRLHDGPAAAGLNETPWNGRDDAGRPVASGLYFARVSGDARESATKLLLLK